MAPVSSLVDFPLRACRQKRYEHGFPKHLILIRASPFPRGRAKLMLRAQFICWSWSNRLVCAPPSLHVYGGDNRPSPLGDYLLFSIRRESGCIYRERRAANERVPTLIRCASSPSHPATMISAITCTICFCEIWYWRLRLNTEMR